MSKNQTKDELDLHRMTVNEALQELDKYLPNAFRVGYLRVLIIHGKGSGTLRREVGHYLTKHTLVRGHRTADSLRGGLGATEVDLVDK